MGKIPLFPLQFDDTPAAHKLNSRFVILFYQLNTCMALQAALKRLRGYLARDRSQISYHRTGC